MLTLDYLPNSSVLKAELFESLCDFRIGSYSLQDRNLIKDDFIVGLEERILAAHGCEYEEYQEWRGNNA